MKNSVLDRLRSYFNGYFFDATGPTARNLFLIVVSILALDIFRFVRSAHKHVLSKLSDTSLNAYYYTLKTGRLDHGSWRDVTVSKDLKAVPVQLDAQPLFLSIDDAMVEKKGEKFGLRSKLFDHAAHNGSNYLDGHCMVSILLSFPVLAGSSIRYLSVPLSCQLWDKKQTKLEMAADMVRHAMGTIGPDRQVFLLCDSWCPKDMLQHLRMNSITLTSSAMPGSIRSCMTSRPSVQENAAAQRNMGSIFHREILILQPQRLELGG